MRIIIAGSRTITDHYEVLNAFGHALALWKPKEVTEIVSGGAKGVDASGEKIAEEFDIAVRVFPAEWDKHGKKAGVLRNIQMAEYGDALLLVWDGKSKGSKNMKEVAEGMGLLVHERIVTACLD